MTAPPKGPFVQAAVFCDRLLMEQDGTASIIRVIDKITHLVLGPDVPAELPQFTMQLKGVVMLKPGSALGRATFALVGERPDGQRHNLGESTVHFEGGLRGVNIPLDVTVTFGQEGLYWFDVLIDGELMTRMPLAVEYDRRVLRRGQPLP